MSVGRMQNAMKAQAALVLTGMAMTRIGLVSSVKSTAGEFMAKVRVMPEDIETGWLPIWSIWAGNGWGLFAPPPVGTQVACLFAENDVENGIVLGAIFNDEDQSLAVPVGEFWLVHKEGAFLKMHNDGSIEMNAPAGLNITAETAITGNLTVTGDITDHAPGNDVTVKEHRDAYNAHKHGGVQTGGGQTATTDHPAT